MAADIAVTRRLVEDQAIEPSVQRAGFQRFAIVLAETDLLDASASMTITVEWAEDKEGAPDDALAWRHLASASWRGGAMRSGTDGLPRIGTAAPPGARSRVRIAVGKPVAMAVTGE